MIGGRNRHILLGRVARSNSTLPLLGQLTFDGELVTFDGIPVTFRPANELTFDGAPLTFGPASLTFDPTAPIILDPKLLTSGGVQITDAGSPLTFGI